MGLRLLQRLAVLAVLFVFVGCSAAEDDATDDANCPNEYKVNGKYLIDMTIVVALSSVQRTETLHISSDFTQNASGISGKAFWNYEGNKWITKDISFIPTSTCNKIQFKIKDFQLPQQEFADIFSSAPTFDVTVVGTLKNNELATGKATYDLREVQTKCCGKISNVLEGAFTAKLDKSPQAKNYPEGVVQ